MRQWFVLAAKPLEEGISEREATMAALFPFPYGHRQEKVELGIQRGVGEAGES